MTCPQELTPQRPGDQRLNQRLLLIMSCDEETKACRSFPLHRLPARLPHVRQASLQPLEAGRGRTTPPPPVALGPDRRRPVAF
ncbi:unnamed protein product [Pleuronectes platessa]|uniref:Uncharacterized protein n=1 Tax=Pleuronectes platessa TaxID=8262 RepID=A0A9N7TNH2_PLEPL|nr:unnamed protein product [Pleuronectes platessa]